MSQNGAWFLSAADYEAEAKEAGKPVTGKIGKVVIPLFARLWFSSRDFSNLVDLTAISIGRLESLGSFLLPRFSRKRDSPATAVAKVALEYAVEKPNVPLSLALQRTLLSCWESPERWDKKLGEYGTYLRFPFWE